MKRSSEGSLDYTEVDCASLFESFMDESLSSVFDMKRTCGDPASPTMSTLSDLSASDTTEVILQRSFNNSNQGGSKIQCIPHIYVFNYVFW